MKQIENKIKKIISDYKNIDSLRYSFNELARIVFGIDFENWFQKGFWDECYKCYSITENDLEIIGFNGKKELCLHFLPIELEKQSIIYREHKNEEMFIYQLKPEKTFAHQLMAHT